MHEIDKSRCPNCSLCYQLKCLSPSSKGNIPLFLSCGHSMCMKCIENIIYFGEPIKCTICHHDMEIKNTDITLLAQNKITLYQLFPVNVYMLGELTLRLMEDSQEKQKNDQNYFSDLQVIMKSTDFTQEPKVKLQKCKMHNRKPLDYYCKDCMKSICMKCMLVDKENTCEDHNLVLMQELNKEFLEDLHDITPKVDETFRRLTQTAVDIGNLLYNIENDTDSQFAITKIMSDIEQHFSKLQAAVQKHKQQIMCTVTKLKNGQKESLKQTKHYVEDSIKKCRTVLNTLNYISNSKRINQINLAALLDEAKLIVATPWYLSRDETNEDPLKVVINEDPCSHIMDYVHIEGNAIAIYKLRSSTELGEELGDGEKIPHPPNIPVYPPELPKDVRSLNKEKKSKRNKSIFYKDRPYYRTNSSASSLNSVSNASSTSVNKTDEIFQKSVVQQVPIHEGMQELVYISHIVDPHNFFVQRAYHQSLVEEMLEEFRNATILPNPSAHDITEGKLYLMFNKVDNIWQRCRVISIDRKKADNPVFHVFCIDFGSTEAVTIDNLRLLPPARVQSPPPLAIHCSLANCEPKGGTWTRDDSLLIQNIIDNKQAMIHVRRVSSSPSCAVQLQCDVTALETGVSVAHALVFHDRARMPDAKLVYPKISDHVKKPKLFMSNHDFKPKSIEEVYITHIISPDNFYVRMRHLQNVYEKLCEDLEKEYSLTNSGTVHLPEIGMVCVVNLDKSQLATGGAGAGWWRCVVRELPGRGYVRVQLFDIGASTLVLWTALKHIHPKFTTIKALATECHLAGVTPRKKKWSPASVALLQHYKERLLELHVEDNRGHGSIGVTLFDREDPDEVYINV